MRRTLAAAAITLFAVGGLAAPATAFDGAAGDKKNANCVGVERAERNSAGGDREKGGFAKEHRDYVASINAGEKKYANFGKFMQTWKAAYCN